MTTQSKPEAEQKPVLEILSDWVQIVIWDADWRVIGALTIVALYGVYRRTRK